MVDHEDDMPREQKLKNPAKPGKELPDIFASIEDGVSKAIKYGATNHTSDGIRQPADGLPKQSR
jgi:hypothetical protein